MLACAGRALLLLPLLTFCACTAYPVHPERPSTTTVPMVSFVFDDGNDTDLLVAREIFAAHKAVASTAITTSFIATPDHLTSQQILALQSDGWEIMAHTVSHPNLKTLDAQELAAEFSRSKAELESIGARVNNLVYPYNKNNELVRQVAARYFRSGRGGTNSFNIAPIDPYFIRSFAMKHDPGKMKGLVDTAYNDRSWLVFYQHELNAKVRISAYSGWFSKGETVRLSPSGASGRLVTTHWFPLYGHAVFFVPLTGSPAAGDTIRGETSGALAKVDSIVYDDKTELDNLLTYIRKNYRDMPVVTIDQALDHLNIQKFTGSANE